MLKRTPKKGSQPQTRQATPECTCPIRGLGSQTSYPRVNITRQAMPEFNERTPQIKRAAEPQLEKQRRRKGALIASRRSNIRHTHVEEG